MKSSILSTGLAAALVASMIGLSPALAKKTVIFTDPDPFEGDNPDFDINEVGFTNKGYPFLTVHGTAGGTKSKTPGVILHYFFQVSDGSDAGGDPDRYIVASHGGIEDSTEVKNDSRWHAHKIELVSPSAACESEGGTELIATEDGRAKVTHNRVVLKDVKPEIIYELATGQSEVSVVDGHVCITGGFNIDLVTIPDV